MTKGQPQAVSTPLGGATPALPADPRPALGGSMVELAYRTLKRRIMHNEIPPGATLDDQAIAAELDISRTPVREAIQRLHGEGFIEIQPRRSSRVLPISVDEMRQIYELLTALEIFAAWTLALRKPTQAELAPLYEATEAMRTTLEQDDLIAWTAADERFHRGLLTLAGNREIAAVGFAYRDRVHRAHMVALRLRTKPILSVYAHEALIALILAGRAEEARDSHLEQRLRAGEELTTLVSKAGLKTL